MFDQPPRLAMRDPQPCHLSPRTTVKKIRANFREGVSRTLAVLSQRENVEDMGDIVTVVGADHVDHADDSAIGGDADMGDIVTVVGAGHVD